MRGQTPENPLVCKYNELSKTSDEKSGDKALLFLFWCTLFENNKRLSHEILIWTSSSFFISWQPRHTLTIPPYLYNPFIPWQSLHTFTIPSYLDNPSLPWQSLHTLTHHFNFDKPFIPWQTLLTLIVPLVPQYLYNPATPYLDNPFKPWKTLLTMTLSLLIITSCSISLVVTSNATF